MLRVWFSYSEGAVTSSRRMEWTFYSQAHVGRFRYRQRPLPSVGDIVLKKEVDNLYGVRIFNRRPAVRALSTHFADRSSCLKNPSNSR